MAAAATRTKRKPPTSRRLARFDDFDTGKPTVTITELQSALDYPFVDPSLLQQALHRKATCYEYITTAYSDEARNGFVTSFKSNPAAFDKLDDPLLVNYLRTDWLKFLGVKILEFIVAHQLFSIYPKKTEGELTVLLAQTLAKEKLAALAKALGIPSAIRFSQSELKTDPLNNDELVAEHLHAVIAAIWIDSEFCFQPLLKKIVRWLEVSGRYPPFWQFTAYTSSDAEFETAFMRLIAAAPLRHTVKHPGLFFRAITLPERIAASDSTAKWTVADHYQRQEFLGDKVLGAVIATILYQNQTGLGFNSNLEALQTCYVELTNNTTRLPNFWSKLNWRAVNDYLFAGVTTSRRPKIQADLVEALMAALWLDCNRDFQALLRCVGNWYGADIASIAYRYASRLSPATYLPSTTYGRRVAYVTPPDTVAETDHYSGPVFTFRKNVLTMSLDEIDSTIRTDAGYAAAGAGSVIVHRHSAAPLESHYDDAGEYYARFIPHIYEEARAMIRQALVALAESRSKPQAIRFDFSAIKIPKKPDNPIALKCTNALRLPPGMPINNCLVIICIDKKPYCLGQVLVDRPRDADDVVDEKTTMCVTAYRLKFIDVALGEALSANPRSVKLSLVPAGSLISLERMYCVVNATPWASSPELFRQIIAGDLSPWPTAGGRLTASLARLTLSRDDSDLNPVQRKAVNTFVTAEDGLYVLQGPPGTGKTTTVVALLIALQKKGERTLVGAPSNKAAQLLAERFIQKQPDVPCLITGVPSKIPEHLNAILLDGLPHRISQYISALGQLVLDDLTRWLRAPKNRAKELSFYIKQKTAEAREGIEILTRYRSVLPPAAKRILTSDIPTLMAKSADIERQIISINKSNINWLLKPKAKRPSFMPTPLERYQALAVSLQHQTQQIVAALQTVLTEDYLLHEVPLVFATLIVTGRTAFDGAKFHTLIVDEAAQSVEAETLVPFRLGIQKALLVGDTKQLPATVTQDNPGGHFEWSMMWRLIEECKQPFQLLSTQYRMQPPIRLWPSNQNYQARLTDGENIRHRTMLPGLGSPVTLMCVDGAEQRQYTSYFNPTEIEIATKLANRLAASNPGLSIGIIAFYAAQVQKLKAAIPAKTASVSTVDGFQGDEKDVIIVSCTRANTTGSTGFVRDFRRSNVALTRAKRKLIVLAHLRTLLASRSSISCFLHFCLMQGYLATGLDEALPLAAAEKDAGVYHSAHAARRTTQPRGKARTKPAMAGAGGPS